MSAQPPSNPNPFDELRSGLQESPPLDEFKAGIADKQPLVQNNRPRYMFGWFDKWMLIVPIILLVLCLLFGVYLWNPFGAGSNNATAPNTAAPNAATTNIAATNVANNAGAQTPGSASSITIRSAVPNATIKLGEAFALNGTAPPGTQVELYNQDKLVSTTTANADGQYEFNTLPSKPGTYALKTVAIVNGQRVESPVLILTVQGDANTQKAPAAAPTTAQTNAQATAAPTSQPNANATAVQPNANANATAVLPNVTANATAAQPNETPAQNATAAPTAASGSAPIVNASAGSALVIGTALSGTAAPNARVVLLIDDAGMATTSADANGQWTIILPTALVPGEHNLRVALADANGQILNTSQPVVITIVAANAQAVPTAQNGAAAAPQPPTVNVQANAVILPGSTLEGGAPPNSRVVLYFNDVQAAQANTDANGKWVIVVPGTVAPGDYTLRVALVDADGKIIAGTPQDLTVQIAPHPLLPVTGGEWK